MIATAPGKLIVAGEYAVLDGAPAVVIAVNRRVIAKRRSGPRGSSEFLLAVADEIVRRHGSEHPAARAAAEIVVDSTPFYAGTHKLGLGSSAAVTVAATALALAPEAESVGLTPALGAARETVPVIDREQVLAIASAAHATAQGARGARGSGADIAAAVYGGVIAYQRATPDRIASPSDAARRGRAIPIESGTADRMQWPSGVTLIPFFTGVSADTATLVAAVQAARERDPIAVTAALTAIENASRAACQGLAVRVPEIAASALLSALALAAVATDQLATATGIALVPPSVIAARKILAEFGGTAKTTGAGGGDIGVGVMPTTEDITKAKRLLIEAGCQPLALTVDATGVDLQPIAQ